ncbi:hypothetical protein JCM16814_26780 [Desulfobaculum senezii]
MHELAQGIVKSIGHPPRANLPRMFGVIPAWLSGRLPGLPHLPGAANIRRIPADGICYGSM